MSNGKRSLGTTPLWLITLLGVAVTALGVYIQTAGTSSFSQMSAGSLAAVGGGVIGAAISLYFAAGEGRDTLRAVRELLAGSLRAGMRSAESELKLIRRHWHYYHLTLREGQFIWRHVDYRFDQSPAANSIVLEIKDVSLDHEYRYRTEVAVRGNRLIMVEAPNDGDTEPPIVVVTPNFTEGYRKVRAGVALLRSWDGDDLLTKCLWSPSPLVPTTGHELTQQDGVTLDAIWDQAFRTHTRILPSVSDNPTVAPGQRQDDPSA